MLASDFHQFTLGGDNGERGRYGPLHGVVATSTRAEALAVAIGLLAPGPLNICTDSKAVVGRIMQIMTRDCQCSI
eukprot:5542349-Alexandrium_andersonii.AAC.1